MSDFDKLGRIVELLADKSCPWMNAKNKLIATARCHPRNKADNRGVAEGEDEYFNGTTGLPVGIH